jgi:hypothetical protein
MIDLGPHEAHSADKKQLGFTRQLYAKFQMTSRPGARDLEMFEQGFVAWAWA